MAIRNSVDDYNLNYEDGSGSGGEKGYGDGCGTGSGFEGGNGHGCLTARGRGNGDMDGTGRGNGCGNGRGENNGTGESYTYGTWGLSNSYNKKILYFINTTHMQKKPAKKSDKKMTAKERFVASRNTKKKK